MLWLRVDSSKCFELDGIMNDKTVRFLLFLGQNVLLYFEEIIIKREFFYNKRNLKVAGRQSHLSVLDLLFVLSVVLRKKE